MSVRSIDGTAGNCYSPIPSNIIIPVPESHFFELILLDSLHYMIGQLFPTYQSGAKRTCVIIVILRQVPALSACRVPRPTVCDFVPWIVEAHLAHCIKMREIVKF